MRRAGKLEKMRAIFLPAPIHESSPRRRPGRGKFRKLLLSSVLVPFSMFCRLLLKLTGRSGMLRPEKMSRIAFIKIDHLGDLIMTAPAVRAIKEWAPAAAITVFTRRQNVPFVSRLPYVDAVEEAEVPWIRPDSGAFENLKECLGLARRIRKGGYDLAVDLRYHNRLDSLLLSLCGASSRLGFDAGGFGFGVTHCARWPRGGHEADKQADALRSFGIPTDGRHESFPLSLRERASASVLVPGGKPVVVVHPGAGNEIKRWMPERFAWTAREISRRCGARIAVLAGPGEEKLGEPILAAVPSNSRVDLRNRLSLAQVASIMAGSRLFIGNDGGAAHVAASVGVPTLVVFSGTSLASEWAPRGERVKFVERWVPCKPCNSTTCPFGQACLRAVGVDEVLSAAIRMLKIPQRRR